MNRENVLNSGDLETDIVVVGGGGTGVTAAAAAAEKGAKVILLEKRNVFGGTSAMAGGIFAAHSPVQKRLMIKASCDQLFKIAMEYNHWKADPRIVRAFVNKSGDTVRWLEQKGLKFGWIPPMYPGQEPRALHWIESEHKGIGGRGAALIKMLVDFCKEKGVQLLTKTPAKRIITDHNGRVSAVLAESEGKEIRMNTKSVIIGTGGYGGNKELMSKYCSFYNENMVCSGIPNMGDGLMMATEIGAGTEGLGVCLLGAPAVRARLLGSIVSEPTMLLMNNKGERFCDENILSHFEKGNPLSRQPGNICYALFDKTIIQNILGEGLQRPGWLLDRPVIYFQPEIDPAELENEIMSQADNGCVITSNSWDKIADWVGAAPDVLEKTIEEYNAYCDRGQDELFAKDWKYLLPLRNSPYYAVKCILGFHGTIGGIRINHRMEVLNQEGNPIPGLYAGGTDTGGWFGDTYPGTHLPGIAFGFAVNSGRIAGENAYEFLLKIKY